MLPWYVTASEEVLQIYSFNTTMYMLLTIIVNGLTPGCG